MDDIEKARAQKTLKQIQQAARADLIGMDRACEQLSLALGTPAKRSDYIHEVAGVCRRRWNDMKKTKKKPKLMNWWPALGPEPKSHSAERKLIVPKTIVKDASVKPSPMAVIERATILATATDDEGLLKELDLDADGEIKELDLEAVSPKGEKFVKKLSKSKRRKRSFDRDFWLCHRVESVAGLSVEVARSVIIAACPAPKKSRVPVSTGWNMEAKPITVTLDYPLSRACEVTIKPYKVWKDGPEYMEIGYVLWVLAQEYLRIYREHKRYGVWGHMMGDLYFERLTLDKKGHGTLYVGS